MRTVRERDQDRPKLMRLVEEAQSGEFARVLLFDWDAMASSNKEDWRPLVYRIHRAGVQVSLAAA